MEDIDLDSVIKGLSSPEVGKNADTLLGMVKEVNVVLKELQTTVAFLDRTGLKPLLVRAAGVKMGVDPETPLRGSQGIDPKTKTHAQIFNHLNSLSEDDVVKMFAQPDEGDKDESC